MVFFAERGIVLRSHFLFVPMEASGARTATHPADQCGNRRRISLCAADTGSALGADSYGSVQYWRLFTAGAALEDRIRVLYDQVKQLSADAHISQATLLGHVMAHEIGHVLLGENSHSSSGIMIKVFRRQELHRAETGKLLFTERQAARMRARIRGVASCADSAGGPNQ